MKPKEGAMAPLFPGEEKESADAGAKPLPVDPIEEMAGALFDPLIVFPAGGWEEDIPEGLKQDLPLRRLAHIHLCLTGKAEWDEATDLEALIYMYPRTLAGPLSEQWSRIYLYLGTRCYGDKFPADIRQETLSDYDMGELRDLKRWIYRKKVEARRAREKGKPPQPVQAVKPQQMKFF